MIGTELASNLAHILISLAEEQVLRKNVLFFSICCLLIPLLASAAETTLLGFSKAGGIASTQLVLEFSALPVYKLSTSGQRLDLLLAKTTAAAKLGQLPEDDVIVKVLLAQKGQDLMVSFLLRRAPNRVQATALPGQDRLSIDLSWDMGQGVARPAIAFTVPGLPGVRSNGASAVVEARSAYAGRWAEFFREYRSPLEIAVPLRHQLPPLPDYPFRMAGGELGTTLETLALATDWGKTLSALRALAPKVPPAGEGEAHFLALQAEALIRTGALPQATELLKRLLAEPLPAALSERLSYLQAFALASGGRADLARSVLGSPATRFGASGPLRPYRALLSAELALAAGDGRVALAALELDDLSWPEGLRSRRERRRADALARSGQTDAALALYRTMLEPPAELATCAFSLNQAAKAFATAGDERAAQRLYAQLGSDLGLNGPTRALAQVAEAYLLIRLDEEQKARTILWKQVDSPYAEAAARSRLKLFDFDVLGGGEVERRRASAAYGEVAAGAALRTLREEAALKQAVTLYLGKDLDGSIAAAGRFIRDFSSGPLAAEGKALLREALPPQVAALIANQDDLQAVVLVEQYRALLVNDALSGPFLLELGLATTRLGLFERACKVYLYLLDAAAGRPEEEGYYLPFLETAFDRGEYELVRTYALRYLTRFPKGKERARAFYLQLRAMQQGGDMEGAAALLQSTQRPKDDALEVLATEVFWALGRYAEVAACFGGVSQGVVSGPPEGLILKAEALCKLGREGEALPIYRQLMGQEKFADQAAFRYAELRLRGGDRREGLKTLRRLAEEGKDPLWRKLAQESLVQAKL